MAVKKTSSLSNDGNGKARFLMRKKKLDELEQKIALCQDFTQRWAKFFNFFGDGFEGRKITADSEAQFFRLMTELARGEFRVSHTIGSEFTQGPDILTILSDAVSLTHIHEMGEGQFAQFQHAWHVVFIALNKTLGRLLQQRPEPKEAAKPKKQEAEKPAAAA